MLRIANRCAEIQSAIAANQAVIVCGATTWGKATQLPKISLALKRGIFGTIGCIQPRQVVRESAISRSCLPAFNRQFKQFRIRKTDPGDTRPHLFMQTLCGNGSGHGR